MEAGRAPVFRASRNIHRVAMLVVALARIVLRGMAIHATRVLQYRRHLTE
jgi:hypothetical protein